MVPLRLTLLGGFDARLAAGAPVNPADQEGAGAPGLPRLAARQPHSRDTLAALLWGERGDERTRDGLR
jgi:hypothetical protein